MHPGTIYLGTHQWFQGQASFHERHLLHSQNWPGSPPETSALARNVRTRWRAMSSEYSRGDRLIVTPRGPRRPRPNVDCRPREDGLSLSFTVRPLDDSKGCAPSWFTVLLVE